MKDIIEIAKQHATEQLVPELEQAYYTFTEQDLREFAQRIQHQWQPIETAPKDGTRIMLWEQYSDVPFIGWWMDRGWTVSHEHVDAHGGWNGAVVVDAIHQEMITHWMPLPQPPQVTK